MYPEWPSRKKEGGKTDQIPKYKKISQKITTNKKITRNKNKKNKTKKKKNTKNTWTRD